MSTFVQMRDPQARYTDGAPSNSSLQRTAKSVTQIASAICAPLLPAAEL
jgi:hypothetical protein